MTLPLPKAATLTETGRSRVGPRSGCRGQTAAGLQRAPFTQAAVTKSNPNTCVGGHLQVWLTLSSGGLALAPLSGWDPSEQPAWAVTRGGIFDLQVELEDMCNVKSWKAAPSHLDPSCVCLPVMMSPFPAASEPNLKLRLQAKSRKWLRDGVVPATQERWASGHGSEKAPPWMSQVL